MLGETFQQVKEQMGPCGIVCGACELGNGTVASKATDLKNSIELYGVKEWAPMVPGGSEIDFDQLSKNLEWVSTYSRCLGCEKGGGPPDCTIRKCANERGYDVCSKCSDLKECDRFEWLGDYGSTQKQKLAESKGKSKKEIIQETLAST
jgi:hypothetical protein